MFLIRSQKLPKGLWALSSTRYDENFKDIAKALPGTIWDKKLRAWIGYDDSVSLIIKRLEEKNIAKVVGDKPGQPTVFSLSDQWEKFNLRPYQQEGAHFLTTHACTGAILADDTGLGKTRTTLAAISALELPALIVCPSVVKYGWVREGSKVGMDLFILNGVKPPEGIKITKDDGILVINYDIVYAWLDILKGVKTIAFDECDALINERSKRSQVCKELAHAAKYRMALSATPMSNRTKELWNIVDTISPNRFGKFFGYALQYCAAEKQMIKVNGEERSIWKMDGASHVEELKERLKFLMLRRTKVDVKLELPPKTRQIIEIDVELNHSAREFSLKNDIQVRKALRVAAKSKLTHAISLASDRLKEGSSVVLFCHERATAHELHDLFTKSGIHSYIATGEDSASKRDEIASEAKANAPSIIVVTTHSMGTGVDLLSFADIGIVVELDYSPAKIIQLEGRLHRSGQIHNVFIMYLIALGTIDEHIKEAVLSKLDIFEKVIGTTGDSLLTDLKGMNDEDSLADLRDYLLKLGEEYVT
jgi:SNF2 family DNA or RNA helicase